MKISELLSTLDNGATKIIIYEPNTGEMHFAGIWFNEMNKDTLEKQVKHIRIDRYEMKIEVE